MKYVVTLLIIFSFQLLYLHVSVSIFLNNMQLLVWVKLGVHSHFIELVLVNNHGLFNMDFFKFSKSIRSVCVKLALKKFLNFFFYHLQMLLLLNFLFLFQLFVTWRHYISNFESDSTYFYYVALHQDVSFYVFTWIVKEFHYFP